MTHSGSRTFVPHSRYRVAKYPVSHNTYCTKPLRGRTGDAVELKGPGTLRWRLVDFSQERSPPSGLIAATAGNAGGLAQSLFPATATG
jgi:hypothetical protein